jgi:hypothetical protein
MSHLRSFQGGPQSTLSQKLLHEVASAKVCLLSPAKKSTYDAQLRQFLAAARPTMSAPNQANARARPVAGTQAPVSELSEFATTWDTDKVKTSRKSKRATKRRPFPVWLAIPAATTAILAAVLVVSLMKRSGRDSKTEPTLLAARYETKAPSSGKRSASQQKVRKPVVGQEGSESVPDDTRTENPRGRNQQQGVESVAPAVVEEAPMVFPQKACSTVMSGNRPSRGRTGRPPIRR